MRGMGCTPSLPGPQPVPRADRREPRAVAMEVRPGRAVTAVRGIPTHEQVRQKFAHLRRTRSDSLSDDFKGFTSRRSRRSGRRWILPGNESFRWPKLVLKSLNR